MSCYIFDFDGTLVDSSERLYRLFNFLVPESTFSKEAYWALKRNKVNHQMILKQYFPKYSFEDFNKRWLSLIEEPEYLALDLCYTDTIKVLKKLSYGNNLYLLTARQSKANLFFELNRLDIGNHFKQIFVTENKYSKEDLLKQIPFTNHDYFISDMGKDIELGNKLKLRTIAITHGFMNAEKLKTYKPWKTIDELSELTMSNAKTNTSTAINHIIVQAGGKGTRLEYLTRNKPKALVPIQNLPMVFHLFRKFSTAKFIIIGDYKIDILKKYLSVFANIDYTVIDASGKSGTCAGISKALTFIPDCTSFILTWCDLVLPDDYSTPNFIGNYIGISKEFCCRWKYFDGFFSEEQSTDHGVAGHFIFSDKRLISDVPDSGEFVRYLANKNISFEELSLAKAREFGLLSEYEKLETEKCRPFNNITIQNDRIIKKGITEQGKKLSIREKAWYSKVSSKNFTNIPKIYSFEPLTMEKICGKNIYEYTKISFSEKKKILEQIINCLKTVQSLESIPSDKASFNEAYIEKTKKRLEKIRNLVPFANDEYVIVNGMKCRNIFYLWNKTSEIINSFFPKKFCLIHGDCTFSNIMLRTDGTPVLIDPRGYFGTTEIYGDTAYDWAKLYYSIVGNYDQFNLKKFRLDIRENDIILKIESNHWEDMEETFFDMVGNEVNRQQIKILHSIIWLSLTTYAWEDYDSICGAFYNGLYYLEEALNYGI